MALKADLPPGTLTSTMADMAVVPMARYRNCQWLM